MTRPQSIVRFERLYWSGILIGLVNTVLAWDTIQAQVNATAGSSILPSGFFAGTLAFGLIVNVLLWYFTARRRSVVAKWIITVFFVFGLVSVARFLFGNAPMPTSSSLSAVTVVMQAVAVWMLFRPDAKAWFEGDRSEELTQTFS